MPFELSCSSQTERALEHPATRPPAKVTPFAASRRPYQPPSALAQCVSAEAGAYGVEPDGDDALVETVGSGLMPFERRGPPKRLVRD